MKHKVVSLLLTGVCMVVCSVASAWSRDGDSIRFTNWEREYCEAYVMDAVGILMSMQAKEPLFFMNDDKDPPSDVRKNARIEFEREAKTYPMEGTKEQLFAAAELFAKAVRIRCHKFLMTLPPGGFLVQPYGKFTDYKGQR